MDTELQPIISHFPQIKGIKDTTPIQSGLINRTYLITTNEADDYILQRINHHVFTNVEQLQHNIECVTEHIRAKLTARGEQDIERKVLRFLSTAEGKTYYFDGTHYWRACVYIRGSHTQTEVTPDTAYLVGLKFGEFESMLADLPEQLEETIPDFHNMEFRMQQLREAVKQDKAGRKKKVGPLIDDIERDADEMCLAERLYREGQLLKRICHCDTKVSNMLFDSEGKVLCIIDLDTVMPSFVFSDFGDFLRTAGSTAPEDEPDTDKIHFNLNIFRAFTKGYLESAITFLTPLEIEMLPYAVRLFPYMQAVRFLTDYLNGDTYYQTSYAEHNYVRTLAQYKLYQETCKAVPDMQRYISQQLKELIINKKHNHQQKKI